MTAIYGTRSAAVTDDQRLAQRIDGMRDAGMSFREIATALNADGVPTVRGGACWRPSSLQIVLGWRRAPETQRRQVERQCAMEKSWAGTARATWRAMMLRCYQSCHESYAYYGARGIRVCDRWHTFANFLADMGERPHGLTLDRIDGDRGYEPGNCRWATALEQRLNQRPRGSRP